eukprot:1138587-Pelagomonas_calceolata.AAC.2
MTYTHVQTNRTHPYQQGVNVPSALDETGQDRASYGRRGDVEKSSCAQKVRHTSDGESRPWDWNNETAHPESGNVAKDVMGKIQVHVFRQSISQEANT